MEATFAVEGDFVKTSIGRSTTVIDASVEDCAAWEFARMTRERMQDHYSFGGLVRQVVKVNNHCDIYLTIYDLGVRSFAPREWLVKTVWKVLDENTMIVGVVDTEDARFPICAGKNCVRASSTTFSRYERHPEVAGVPQTRVTYYQQVDLRGFIPKFVANAKSVGALSYIR